MEKRKYIRKYILSCILLSASLCLSGCQAAGTAVDIVRSVVEIATGANPRAHMTGTVFEDQVLPALDAGDKEAFKSMFCDDTAALPDFDEKTDEFFTFYQGASTSAQCTAAFESGMLSEYMEKNYNVYTDEGSYSVSLCFTQLEDEEKGLDESRIGLNSILILTGDLADEAQYTQWPPEDGIFILYDIGDCRT